MNQILLTKNKYYKKKYLLIFQFTISIIIVSTIIYFLFNYFYKIKKQEYLSKELTNNYNLSLLYSNIEMNDEKSNNNNIFGTIEIPKLNIKYPIFSKLTEENLKISPCKFYGDNLEDYGNICIAGHNYDNGKFFSNIMYLNNDDVIYIYSNNLKYTYTIYSMYEVNSNDLTPIINFNSNQKCLTLVTCNNLNNNRIIVKAVQ